MEGKALPHFSGKIVNGIDEKLKAGIPSLWLLGYSIRNHQSWCIQAITLSNLTNIDSELL